MAPERQKSRGWLLLLMAIIAVLLAVTATWVSLPATPVRPELGLMVEPEVRVPSAPAPHDPVEQPARSPAPAKTVAPAPEITPKQWRIGGAHMPECWPRNYEPKPLDPSRRCTSGDRIDLCLVGDPKFHEDVTLDNLHDLLATAEAVLGMKREARLTILIYEIARFQDAKRERALRGAVAGFFDGHVHVEDSLRALAHRTLRHEVLHAVMGPAIGCAPRSVHEGVADWFDGDLRISAWNYLLWRGAPAPGRSLDRLITSDDWYEVGLGYAEASARVHHAVARGGEGAVRDWLIHIQSGTVPEPAAAWQNLEQRSDEPVMNTVADELLGEVWTPGLSARLDRHSIACASLYSLFDDPGLLVYGAAAIRRRCAVLDRDPEDPSLLEPVSEAIVNYDEWLERSSGRALKRKQERFLPLR
ncbi:MAG: hypothetical protein AB8H79_22895 [Myxococcota bacterium]